MPANFIKDRNIVLDIKDRPIIASDIYAKHPNFVTLQGVSIKNWIMNIPPKNQWSLFKRVFYWGGKF